MKDISEIPSPCFVLEEDKFLRNLQVIDRIQQEAEIDIILAFKGFSMWSVFPQVRKYVNGATASSLNEVLLCNEHMNSRAHTYCVAYTPQEFEEIASKSSHITFNSLNQYQKFVDQTPTGVSIGLRVNPGWSDVEIDLYKPSSPDSRLGIDKIEELPGRVEGLHFHVLCESSASALEEVLENFESRFGHLLKNIKWVNMGGGHLMTRENYDVQHLIDILKKFKKDHEVDIILEPGSAFAWETGYLKTTVLDIVESGGIKTAIIDASFTCHMPDCLEMPYRPNITGAYTAKRTELPTYRIGGVSCLAGDFLEEYSFDQPLEVGSEILFQDMMHYTMVKTNMFNGVKHPSIGIQRTRRGFELIKEFVYSDYENRLS